MEVTRRYWTAAGTALALAGLAVLLDSAVPAFGTAAVGGWLLVRQVAFRRDASAAVGSLAVSLSLDRDRVRTEDPVVATLVASVDAPAGHAVTVSAAPPLAAAGGSGAAATIGPDDEEASAIVEFAVPFAGRFRLPDPTATVVDAGGLFRSTVDVDGAATVLVEPRRPRSVHVGRGGDPVAATFGAHRAGRTGAGTVPAGVREYTPGDDVRRIDWAATARLDGAYVRELETETDRTTALVVDAGPGMGTGTAGETQLDYAVHVALSLLGVAADAGDPVGLCVVDGSDEVHWQPPAATPTHYAALRDALRGVVRDAGEARDGPRSRRRGPARRGALLAADSPFAPALRPLLGDVSGSRADVAGDPLVETVRVATRGAGGDVWTALVTDDGDRSRVVEAVRAARRGNDRVTSFLLPDVLFEPGGLADVESAYERYRDFEAFRRRLDRLPHVEALEVGPADRVEAVLAARRGVDGP